MTGERADLVCEGGGVRGIGLVGAVDVLARAGYSFPRVAGSSAGAIVASFVAALQRAGEPLNRLHEIVESIDYTTFQDRSLIGRIPLIGSMLSLFTSDGIYEGEHLESFVAGVLGDLGVRTFGDLRTDDAGAGPGGAVDRKYAWSLVITASDLSRRRLVRIPWDLPAYKKDPDEFPVATAVRASAAIPFLFQPVRVSGATWVDGGLIDDFPIELFDRPDSVAPQWPTFGIRLSARPGLVPPTRAVRGPLSIALAALGTLLGNQDAAYENDPCTVRRTVFVPSDAVSPIDFGITDAEVDALYGSGTDAARAFLSGWDFDEYVTQCRRGVPGGLGPEGA